MRRPLTVLLVTSLLLTSCGWRDSRVNPGNWFGNGRSAEVISPESGSANPLIPARAANARRSAPADFSVAVATVTQMRVTPSTTGAILLVTGVTSRQGAFNAELRPDPVNETTASNTLSFTLRVDYPGYQTAVGPELTRTIHVARSLSKQDLNGIRLIRVNGGKNAIESRRR